VLSLQRIFCSCCSIDTNKIKLRNIKNKIYEAVDTGIQKALIITNDQSNDSSVRFHNKEISTEFIPYELRTVDLGLPSETLWCEYNLGAIPSNNHKDWYGDYYAWGETEPIQGVKSNYDTYKFVKNNKFIKYNHIDNKATLDKEDDAAYQNYHKFRIPEQKHCIELLCNTTHKFIKNYKGINDLNGVLFTSKHNGSTLFFPASGYIGHELYYRCVRFYAHSSTSSISISPYDEFTYALNNEHGVICGEIGRAIACPIRAIQDKNKNIDYE